MSPLLGLGNKKNVVNKFKEDTHTVQEKWKTVI